MKILDISEPANIRELASFDTWTLDDNATFEGCWGVFPFFDTHGDLLVATDTFSGLFVLEYKGPLGALAGIVTRFESPMQPMPDATVRIVQSNLSATTDSTGQFLVRDVAGAVDLEVSAFGFVTKTVSATIVEGVVTPLDVALSSLPSASLTGVVTSEATSLPIGHAIVEVVDTPLSEETAANGAYDHSSVPLGTHTVRARAFGYDALEARVPIASVSGVVVDFVLPAAFVVEDFESSSPGWSVSGSATKGDWERGDPSGTSFRGKQVQPADDHTPGPGTKAWITDVRYSSSVQTYDVDGGETVLTSPSYDLTGLKAARVSFRRWYSTGVGDPDRDVWTVEVSPDGGREWVLLESLEHARAQWDEVDVAVFSLVGSSAATRFRFTARDTAAISVTEAGIDDFMIYDVDTLVVPDVVELPDTLELSLCPARPNPLRPGGVTTFSLVVQSTARVDATIHDVRGRRIATVAGKRMAAGEHQIEWDGRGSAQGLSPSGLYFLRVRVGSQELPGRKVLLLH